MAVRLLGVRERRERERATALDRRIDSRAAERGRAREKLLAVRYSAMQTASTAPAVLRACRGLPRAERVEALRGQQVEEARKDVERLQAWMKGSA